MGTENSELMRMARESLKGKWGLAVGTFVIYMLILLPINAIPKIGTFVGLIIAGPFATGIATFALAISRNEEAKLEQIFSGFNYLGKAIATYLLMLIFVLLLLLLFIVPGVIAALSYSLSFYILAEEPALTPTEVLTKSKEMMDGYKWKLFLLSLWFALLLLLSVFTLGVALLWLLPYIAVTQAKFYDDVKANYQPAAKTAAE